jgi:aspartate oxidase
MWYNKVVKSLENLPDAIEYFEDELEAAKKSDLNMKGRPIEKISAEVPGVVEQRYNQLQEIEAILEHLNIQLQKLRTSKFRDVTDMAVLVNEFALLRNKWIGLHKALEAKNFQINNIVKLRTAGLDDATIF